MNKQLFNASCNLISVTFTAIGGWINDLPSLYLLYLKWRSPGFTWLLIVRESRSLCMAFTGLTDTKSVWPHREASWFKSCFLSGVSVSSISPSQSSKPCKHVNPRLFLNIRIN